MAFSRGTNLGIRSPRSAAASVVWTPAALASAQHWWSSSFGKYSDAGTTPSVVDGVIQQLNDRIGSNNLSAATTQRPLYKVLSGKDVILTAAASSQRLLNASVSALQTCTVAIALKAVTTGGGAYRIGCTFGQGSGEGKLVWIGESNSSKYTGSNNSVGTDCVTGTVDTSWHTYIVTRTPSAVTFYLDGTLVDSKATTGTMLAGFVLGAYDANSPSLYYDGYLTDSVITNAEEDATTRGKLHTYLQSTFQ